MIQIFAFVLPSHEHVIFDRDGMFGREGPCDDIVADLVHPYHASPQNMVVSHPLVKQDCSPWHLLPLVSNVSAITNLSGKDGTVVMLSYIGVYKETEYYFG